MKQLSYKQTDRALFNLSSMLDKLECDKYDALEEENWAKIESIQEQINTIEKLLNKMYTGKVKASEWALIQKIVSEREFIRYNTCLVAGMSEQEAGKCFE